VLVQRKLHFPSKEEEIVQRDSVFLSADGFLRQVGFGEHQL
jgi:hypothetical protein